MSFLRALIPQIEANWRGIPVADRYVIVGLTIFCVLVALAYRKVGRA